MDELTRALQISRHADAIIADPGNASKCLSNAHAIKGLAEAIDEAEHSKVRKMISINTFSEEKEAPAINRPRVGGDLITDGEIHEATIAPVEEKEAPAPANKMAPEPKNKAAKKSK